MDERPTPKLRARSRWEGSLDPAGISQDLIFRRSCSTTISGAVFLRMTSKTIERLPDGNFQ
jgi:hypothetical protein